MNRTVLDHGFVKLLNLAGPTRRPEQDFDAHDVDPAQTARMSFDGRGIARDPSIDLRLSEYLLKNWHTTPFEMIEIWLEMKLPIFVARQFVRHRTCTINEVSGRYVTLPAEWYIPALVGGSAPDKKQGQADNLPEATQELFRWKLNEHCANGYAGYESSIAQGVAHEHARLLLSLNHYTHWVWKQDLHNMMHFLSLRSHEHAQVEAREYALAIIAMLRQYLPKTMELFDKYRTR